MATLELTPVDNNYLTSNLVFRQLTQNSVYLELDSNNASASTTPKISLDGSGRAYLSGSLTITASSPAAGMPLFYLPSFLSIPQQYNFPVVNNNGGTLTTNSITLVSNTSGIQSVNVTSMGSYTTLPTVGTLGPGSGATFSTEMSILTASVVTSQSGAGSYAPGDTIVPAAGTSSVAGVLKVSTTGVKSATVAAGGSGGTNGTQTVTGTTGTGTKFTASVTVSGGAITAVLSILTAGSYTANPTVLTNEPVTGAGLSGAALSVVMGVVGSVAVTTSGNYTVLSSNPVSQASTSGSGTGATFTLTWGITAIVVLTSGEGYDSMSSIVISGGGGSGGAASIVLESSSTQVVCELGATASTNNIISLDGIVFLVNSYT